MNKLGRIISIILIGFVLSSLVIYRMRLGDGHRRQPADTSRAIKSEIKMIGGQQVTFDFDGRTEIVESGRAVQPASIPRGASATVKYTQRAGKNWARKIELLAAVPPGPSDTY